MKPPPIPQASPGAGSSNAKGKPHPDHPPIQITHTAQLCTLVPDAQRHSGLGSRFRLHQQTAVWKVEPAGSPAMNLVFYILVAASLGITQEEKPRMPFFFGNMSEVYFQGSPISSFQRCNYKAPCSPHRHHRSWETGASGGRSALR